MQLKIRTEYSFGKTFAPIHRIISRLKDLDVRVAGIVDDSTWGHIEWNNACIDAGIKPVFGVEISVSDNETPTKMWFLARNYAGLMELYHFNTKAHAQSICGRFGKSPRLYKCDVLNMSKNIVKFAGDILDEKFLQQINAVIDLNPASKILNIQKQKIADKLGLLIINTCDNYYAYEEDREIFELITNSSLKPTPQHIIPFNTHSTNNHFHSFFKEIKFKTAPSLTSDGDLEKICRDGIQFRDLQWNSQYEKRLQYELNLIRDKNFESYFIIVSDMCRFAKKHMLVGPSRGSAAGSLVCYLSQITEIDPLPPGLYFERFIDISRTDLPDIDLDFPDNKRHLVFEYMAKKYGLNNVAHIGTINKYKPKSALITICKALKIPSNAISAIKSEIIQRNSADERANNCLEDTLKTTSSGRQLLSAYPAIELAAKIESHASHAGVHAAGLLICKDKLTNYATIDENNIAHLEKQAAEQLGLLKIDILGLRTLGILEDSGVNIDWYRLPLNDKKTLDVFNSGRFCGVFQFEGNALRSISKRIHFKSIVEIDAVTALARPGPIIGGVAEKYINRLNGEEYSPIHPLVERHMTETYGLPVYQEQTLAIVREIGKFDWKETSIIRKAMSKSLGKEFFDSYWQKFKEGAIAQGIEEGDAKKTWEMINAMGSWQMNKAHTYSYAVISYWTAYLKAHYPLEFAAANLRNAKDEDSAVLLLREMVREGIEYIPFDIELSESNWSVKNGKLYGGFMALKGVGEATAKKIIDNRAKNGINQKTREMLSKRENPFKNIYPITTAYKHIYDDPREYHILDDVVTIDDLKENMPHGCERVFIGELIFKKLRNANEEILIERRNGKIETDPLLFLDLKFRDDTGMIGARISRWQYKEIGEKIFNKIPIGTHFLIRAKFFNGIRYAFISKWKDLQNSPNH